MCVQNFYPFSFNSNRYIDILTKKDKEKEQQTLRWLIGDYSSSVSL